MGLSIRYDILGGFLFRFSGVFDQNVAKYGVFCFGWKIRPGRDKTPPCDMPQTSHAQTHELPFPH